MFLAPTLALALSSVGSGWLLTGMAHVYGIDEPFQFQCDGGLRFRFSATGQLPDINGFDGLDAWVLNHSGVPHVETRQGSETDRIVAWIIDGQWSSQDTPLIRTRNPDGSISLSCRGGCGLTARLELDGDHHPASLKYWAPDGDTTWTFEKYHKFAGVEFPTHISFTVGREHYSYDVKAAEPRPQVQDDFTMPQPATDDTHFDPTADPKLQIKHIGGYFFVHPLVDGQDVGWFFLDTGAGAMVLDSAAANKLHVRAIGHSVAAGVVATVDTPIDRTERFKLGPVTITSPTFIELDLGQIAKVFNLTIGGVCGYDFLSRVTLAIDAHKPEVVIYPSDQAPVSDKAAWTPFQFTGNLIGLTCRFEGNHEGFFTIDTGSGSAVDFTTPAVRKFSLLKGRTTTTVHVGGAGGSAPGKTGSLAWFEIAGQRVDSVNAGFESATTGVYASPYLDGNIGAEILGRFRLVLDYRHHRLALLPPN